MGETVTLAADTNCGFGGVFTWSSLPGLVADGATAIYTPQTSGKKEITATYSFPDGASFSRKHSLEVKGCTVSITGPAEIELGGERIMLTASGNPTGGNYAWNSPLDLAGQGATVEVSGSAAGEHTISVIYYILDDVNSTSCDAKHTIRVRDCQLSLSGVSVAAVGEPTLFIAEGQPAGGSCAWLSPDGLLDQGLTAQFTAQVPGLQSFQAEYTTPGGDTCLGTYDTTFIKVASIASPYTCVNSGTTLEKSSFIVTSEPPGHVDTSSFSLTVSPLNLHTISQSSTETITASITPNSILDDATMMLTVVNQEVKTSLGTEIKIEIPDYFSDALAKVGLADKAMLKFGNSLSKKLSCCERSSVKDGRELQLFIGIEDQAGPFTILGLPLPQSLKKYVTLDALAVTFAGIGKGAIKGDYEGCQDSTQWGGSGVFSASADVGGEVKVKSPGDTIVIEGSLKGATGVSEEIKVQSPNIVLSGGWDGMAVSGRVTLTFIDFTFP